MTKRRRSTVLARRKDGRYLLVKEKGNRSYSLPGGGVEPGEPTLLAAVRELHEETRLKVSQISYIDDIDGERAYHYVFLAEVYGEVRLQRKEISAYRWWDGQEPTAVPLQGHVRGALALLNKPTFIK